MITPAMNKFEIQHHILKAYKRHIRPITVFGKSVDRKWSRLPKSHIARAKMLYWRQEHQNYIILHFRVFGVSSTLLFAVVDHGNKVWIYRGYYYEGDTMDVYSMHFFKRYAERTGTPYIFPNIVGKFIKRNTNSYKIYRDPETDRSVYACKEGIQLCEYDAKRDITKFCTFVSCDMLGENQLKAWNLVQHKLQEVDDICKTNKSLDKKYEMIDEWADSTPEVALFASYIYNKYYTEMEEGD